MAGYRRFSRANADDALRTQTGVRDDARRRNAAASRDHLARSRFYRRSGDDESSNANAGLHRSRKAATEHRHHTTGIARFATGAMGKAIEGIAGQFGQR